MSKVFCTLTITAAAAPMARQLAAALPAGGGMFVAGFHPRGNPGAVIYVSEGDIEQEFADALSSPEALVGMLAAAGVPMALAQAQALLSQATVSERPFSEMAAELDLVPVQGGVL